jgi:hypothetical protein
MEINSGGRDSSMAEEALARAESVLDSKRWVVKRCRRVAEVMRLGIPAFPSLSKAVPKHGDSIPFSLLDLPGAAKYL